MANLKHSASKTMGRRTALAKHYYCICGARAVANMPQPGILLVKFSGLLTAETLSRLRTMVLAHSAGARAVVLDYLAATLAMDERDMLWVVTQHDDMMAELPTAIVADAEMRKIFPNVLGWEALKGGRLRKITDSPADALSWARGKAQSIEDCRAFKLRRKHAADESRADRNA